MSILLFTPPFTQLNTPYPATAYLKGFLNTKNIQAEQADLGLDVILSIFSKQGLVDVFKCIKDTSNLSENVRKIYALRQQYIQTIDFVLAYLQGRNPAAAYNICQYNFLPQAGRFEQLTDLEYAFGTLGIADKAKYIATMYLEDLGDFIAECIDSHFGFSRYAERLSRSAQNFDDLYDALHAPPTYIDNILLQHAGAYIKKYSPICVVLSVPFPGNLYAALRLGKWIKMNYPAVKVAMGGGYPNTELRSIKDVRLFECIDYLSLDDGERPLENIYHHCKGQLPDAMLKRTFICTAVGIEYCNGDLHADYKQKDVGTPDYRGLKLDQYISVIEVANPMHKLWSDGRWNKLTLAHGCYWGKCTFCDISLDYIKNYEATTASILVDRIAQIIADTNSTAFHFVDEAAPPALMKQLALELLKRELKITWWTNVRFEKNFTKDLCLLLAASGCIAISGGLEVASDRLLKLIDKGVTVAQVAQVTHNFTQAGILVHAYLMYGFPTQTAQETIDSLEYVRQLFEQDVIQSGFWHQFAMTAHSPIGRNPDAFGVKAMCGVDAPFANNDLPHEDPGGCQHELFQDGLRKSLFNYMNGMGIDFPLQEWFDFKIPRTSINPHAIANSIAASGTTAIKDHRQLLWLGSPLEKITITKKRKGKQTVVNALLAYSYSGQPITLVLEADDEAFLLNCLPMMGVQSDTLLTVGQFKQMYISQTGKAFELFWQHPSVQLLREDGLLVL